MILAGSRHLTGLQEAILFSIVFGLHINGRALCKKLRVVPHHHLSPMAQHIHKITHQTTCMCSQPQVCAFMCARRGFPAFVFALFCTPHSGALHVYALKCAPAFEFVCPGNLKGLRRGCARET